MADDEISVNSKGVTLRGEVVNDVRPAVKRFAKTSDSVLRLLDNVVGLPADFVSNNLERFRKKYAHRFEEIPMEQRQEPPMRIGCAVLKHVAYSADEPDIQEMFANLLATASNTETVRHVHPGFATVISELRAIDAVVLRTIVAGRIGDVDAAQPVGFDLDEFDQAISNLMRLGLLDWETRPYSPRELSRLAPKSYGGFMRPEQTQKMLVDVINDVQKLKGELIKKLSEQHQRVGLQVTIFGRHFLAAVSEPSKDSVAPGPAGPQN